MKSLFEISQEYKGRIEASSTLMDALRTYAKHKVGNCDDTLHHLGSGRSNTHYRLGELESGLWVATRENHVFLRGNSQKNIAENYAQTAEWYRSQGKRTTSLIVGVRLHLTPVEYYQVPGFREDLEDEDRYALIVEDFTKGGSPDADFRPGISEDIGGTLNGERVMYDFDDDISKPVKYLFMHDKSIIHINPKNGK